MSLGFTRTPAEHQSRSTHHSLEILLSEVHVLLHYAVILVNGGIEDEGVIGVDRIISLILLKPVRESVQNSRKSLAAVQHSKQSQLGGDFKIMHYL